MDKRELRRHLSSKLRDLTSEEKAAYSQRIQQHLEEDPAFRAAQWVFAYLSLPSEPVLDPLIGSHPHQRWAFPRVEAGSVLIFHELSSPSDGEVGTWGIREPSSNHSVISPEAATVILVPGLGFDPSTGARIGRGKGHYDRFLALTKQYPHPPQIIGIAFSAQLTPLQPEAHDIPMDRLLTENGWVPLPESHS